MPGNYFVIDGSGVVVAGFAGKRPIYKVHPVEIPIVPGLDAFKRVGQGDLRLVNAPRVIDDRADVPNPRT